MLELTTSYYKIADHVIKIVDHIGIDLDRALPTFRPFALLSDCSEYILTIDIRRSIDMEEVANRKVLSDVSVIWMESFRFEENEANYYTSILSKDQCDNWSMCSEKDFSKSVIYPISEELYTTTKLSWLIMVAFGQACLTHHTLLLHASVVENGDVAVAFLGKSGTGKSTHSRLWIDNNPNIELLNDDNPAVRIFPDNTVMIYGTPWSGKTHCYRDERRRLSGIVRLEQAPINELTVRNGLNALTDLLPSSSAIRWNALLFDRMVSSLERIIDSVRVAKLRCLPDKEAVKISYSFVFGNKDAN